MDCSRYKTLYDEAEINNGEETLKAQSRKTRNQTNKSNGEGGGEG